MSAQKNLITGSTVPSGGMYKVSHGSHRLPPVVYLLEGQRFPRCSKYVECEDEVVFTFLGPDREELKWQTNYVHELPVREDDSTASESQMAGN